MILITGSKGFIGSNLIKRFNPDNIICVDIEDCFSISIMWSTITKIYHVGAISSTTEKDVNRIYLYNIDYSIKLFNIAIEHNIPVVYLSSAAIFGNSLSYQYSYQYNPLNFYATSKVMVDLFIEDNMHKFKNIVVIRPFNVYGSNELHKGNQASPVTQFEQQAKNINRIRIFKGSDKFIRDFIWVENLIDCMLQSNESGFYDGGTSNPISFLEVAELISSKYNCPIEEIPFPEYLKGKYQFYTCARYHLNLNRNFTTVNHYVKHHLS